MGADISRGRQSAINQFYYFLCFFFFKQQGVSGGVIILERSTLERTLC